MFTGIAFAMSDITTQLTSFTGLAIVSGLVAVVLALSLWPKIWRALKVVVGRR